MAQKISIELIDDLDGSIATETIKFGIDGVHYDIDLGSKNAGKLRSSLGSFVSAGRRTSGRRVSRSTTKKTPGGASGMPSGVRAWALSNGYTVSSRGRIPEVVQQAYDLASLEWSKSLHP